MTDTRTLRERVFESMDNAKANAYDQTTWPVEEIINDILEYDGTLEDETPESLRPHVEAWLAREKS